MDGANYFMMLILFEMQFEDTNIFGFRLYIKCDRKTTPLKTQTLHHPLVRKIWRLWTVFSVEDRIICLLYCYDKVIAFIIKLGATSCLSHNIIHICRCSLGLACSYVSTASIPTRSEEIYTRSYNQPQVSDYIMLVSFKNTC